VVFSSGNHTLDACLHYLPYRVQLSGAAKNAPANKQILEDNFPGMLKCGLCWTKVRKDKNEFGSFITGTFILTKRGKLCGTVWD